MSIATRQLGLADHGHPVALEEFESAEFQEGYKYEIIDGRLYVAPMPNLPEDQNVAWLYEKLVAYKLKHPNVIRYLSQKARVFVPGREELSCPYPDISVYRLFSSDPPPREQRWQNY